ncbi:MAG: VanZ family protein, partial [Candidatus Binatia bacterium]
VHAVIRKGAHFTEYALFGALLVRAFRSETGPTPRSPLAAAIVFATGLALLDEGNQFFSRARTGALLDCAIDTIGAAAGALAMRAAPRGTQSVARG